MLECCRTWAKSQWHSSANMGSTLHFHTRDKAQLSLPAKQQWSNLETHMDAELGLFSLCFARTTFCYYYCCMWRWSAHLKADYETRETSPASRCHLCSVLPSPLCLFWLMGSELPYPVGSGQAAYCCSVSTTAVVCYANADQHSPAHLLQCEVHHWHLSYR